MKITLLLMAVGFMTNVSAKASAPADTVAVWVSREAASAGLSSTDGSVTPSGFPPYSALAASAGSASGIAARVKPEGDILPPPYSR